MASAVYNYAKVGFMDGTIDWDAGGSVFKVLLVTAAYTFNPDHRFVSDLGAVELPNGTGYQPGFSGTGRKAIGSRSVAADLTNDRAEATGANVEWLAINDGTISAGIIYKEGTSDSDSVLIAYMDIPDTATNGGNITFQWNAEGILQAA